MGDNSKDISVAELDHTTTNHTVSEKPSTEDDALHGFQADQDTLPKG